MNKPSRLIAVVAVFALTVACTWYLERPAAAQEKKGFPAPAAVTKWEYRIVVIPHNGEDEGQKELNKLGEEGYEIAFVTGGQITRASGGAKGGGGDSNPVFHYTLKRAKK
jgi:hypothetical protein